MDMRIKQMCNLSLRMASQTLPAVGNGFLRFFATGQPPKEPELRLYQCEKKKHGIGYDCAEQTSGMLVGPSSKLIGIPAYIPKQLDTLILHTRLLSTMI